MPQGKPTLINPQYKNAVTDPGERKLLLLESLKANAPVLIWTPDQELSFEAVIASVDPNLSHFKAALPQNTDIEGLQNKLRPYQNSDFQFNIPLAQANLFFRSRLTRQSKHELSFSSPSDFYKVQQRKDPRFRFRKGQLCYVGFTNPNDVRNLFSAPIFDIGAGGLSFLVSSEDEELFSEGRVIKNMVFVIEGREILAQSQVTHTQFKAENSFEKVLESLPDEVLKVGVRFRLISPTDIQWIAQYVLEETKKRTQD